LRGEENFLVTNLLLCVGCEVMVTSLRVDNKLSGADNFGPWKERTMLLLEEVEV